MRLDTHHHLTTLFVRLLDCLFSDLTYSEPFKRPLSSAVPTIIEKDGRVEVVIGASGGSRITTSTTQSILNMIDFNIDVYDAIKDPDRLHHQFLPNEISAESTFSASLEQFLKTREHQVKRMPEGITMSGVSGIRRLSDGTIEGKDLLFALTWILIYFSRKRSTQRRRCCWILIYYTPMNILCYSYYSIFIN